MSDKNMGLELWKKVEKTDKSITKDVDRGGWKITAIDAYHQFRNATEQFGPFGIGWGTEDDKYEEVNAGLLLYTATFWYHLDGVKGTFPIASATLMFKKDKLNSDCFKAVRTDAMTKALSLLGFNADVFMGKFDGNKYVDDKKKTTRKDAPAKESSGDWDGTEVIKFGTHKGKTFADMEDTWLEWVIEKSSLAKYTKDSCQKEIDRRQQPEKTPTTMADDDAPMTEKEMGTLNQLFDYHYDADFWKEFKETHPTKLTFGLYKKFKGLLEGADESGADAGMIGESLDRALKELM